jgi:chemotaxis signal transduction protein
VAVIHLGRLLELPEQLDAAGERNVVILRSLQSGRANRAAAGLLVDRILGVRDVEDDQVLPPPTTLAPEPASYLRGLARAGNPPRPLLVLDVERVLQSERLRPFRRTAS